MKLRIKTTPMMAMTIFCTFVIGVFFVSIIVRFVGRMDDLKDAVRGLFGVEVMRAVDWSVVYPFADGATTRKDDRGIIELWGMYLQDKLSWYTGEGLMGHNELTYAARRYDTLIAYDLYENRPVNGVLRMKNGYLIEEYPPVSDEWIARASSEVASLAACARENGAIFIYMNAPTKICPIDRQLSEATLRYEHSNENADAMLAALNAQGVETIDGRDLLLSSGVPWYDLFFKNDHHWTPRASLIAARALAYRLNEMGFDFDMALFEDDAYDMETFDRIMTGAQGRKMLLGVEPEPYERLLPRSPTLIRVEVPDRSLDITGPYDGSLFRHDHFEAMKTYTDRQLFSRPSVYECMNVRNDAVGRMTNLAPPNNAGRRILMLIDSYGWYAASYLACDVERVDTICQLAFSGSIREFIRRERPDAVVMMTYAHHLREKTNPLERGAFDLE